MSKCELERIVPVLKSWLRASQGVLTIVPLLVFVTEEAKVSIA